MNTKQTAIVPSKSDAENFLTLLDETTESFTFQTFDDDQDAKRRILTKVLIGSLDQHFAELSRLNQHGAGVYVTVNETDGKGRKNENITRIRACFIENDTGSTPPLPLEPHIVVESSPGKHHYYFLADGLSIDDFRAVQRRLVDNYNSDPSACDQARVLRLPGFYHQKRNTKKRLMGTPHMVRVATESGAQPYTRDQMLETFPPLQKEVKTSIFAPPPPSTGLRSLDAVGVTLRAALCWLKSDDRELWIAIAHGLKRSPAGEALGDFYRALFFEWSQQSEKFDSKDCARVWASCKPNNTDYRAIFAKAQAAGWVNPGEQSYEYDKGALVEEAIKRHGERPKVLDTQPAMLIGDSMPDFEPYQACHAELVARLGGYQPKLAHVILHMLLSQRYAGETRRQGYTTCSLGYAVIGHEYLLSEIESIFSCLGIRDNLFKGMLNSANAMDALRETTLYTMEYRRYHAMRAQPGRNAYNAHCAWEDRYKQAGCLGDIAPALLIHLSQRDLSLWDDALNPMNYIVPIISTDIDHPYRKRQEHGALTRVGSLANEISANSKEINAKTFIEQYDDIVEIDGYYGPYTQSARRLAALLQAWGCGQDIALDYSTAWFQYARASRDAYIAVQDDEILSRKIIGKLKEHESDGMTIRELRKDIRALCAMDSAAVENFLEAMIQDHLIEKQDVGRTVRYFWTCQ